MSKRSFLPSASPPAVHQLKNSNLPVALSSGLTPSTSRSASVPPPKVMSPPVVPVVAVASVMAPPVVAVASVVVAEVFVGTAGGVVTSPPHADNTGRTSIIMAASHAALDLIEVNFCLLHDPFSPPAYCVPIAYFLPYKPVSTRLSLDSTTTSSAQGCDS